MFLEEEHVIYTISLKQLIFYARIYFVPRPTPVLRMAFF